MRLLFTLLLGFVGLMGVAMAQAVTTVPAFPTADAELTLIFDLKQAKDSRAAGLLGKTDDVFLWSGAGSTATGDAFQFQPAGQTNFNVPFAPGRMTSLGGDRWQIKLVPRTYFNVPTGTPIRRLGVLLKSGDGRAQTEDFFVTIFDSRLSIQRVAPTGNNLFVDADATLPVRYRVSQAATLTLALDGQTVATAANVDSLRSNVAVGNQPGQRRTLVLRATAGDQSASDTLLFTVRPQPNVAALPSGVQDSLPYLKRLGITTIELMPIMEFSGNDSWGYNPIFYFAPDKAYGTADDLKRFIDACHVQGIKVVLDMVLNQADFEFPYVKLYWDGTKPSADSPFFNPQATHPFSVFFDFNHESPATQAFVERVNRFWLTEYRFDGFRFDLSKGFTQRNTGSDVAAWSAYDASRVAIWRRIYGQLTRVNPVGLYILEHFADNREETELADLGFWFWGNANGDLRNVAKGFQANISGISYRQRGWPNPNLLSYAESHDEERLLFDVLQNGRTEGTYNIKSLPTALDRAKLAATLLMAVPGPKLIWQFGEFGYDISINQNGRTGAKPLRWEYLQDANRLKLFKVYQALIGLKKTVPAFRASTFTLDYSGMTKRLVLPDAANTIYLLANTDAVPQNVAAGFPQGGTWFDYFTGQSIAVSDPQASVVLQPGEFHIYSTQKLPTPEANLVPWPATLSVVTATEPGVGATVSPNPVRDQLTIELRSTYRGLVHLVLRDAGGKSLRSWQPNKAADTFRQTFLVSELPAGLYLLHIGQGEQRETVKVLKQ